MLLIPINDAVAINSIITTENLLNMAYAREVQVSMTLNPTLEESNDYKLGREEMSDNLLLLGEYKDIILDNQIRIRRCIEKNERLYLR